MDETGEARVSALQQELIESATMLFAVQKVEGNKVKESTQKAYKRLVDAHMLLTGVIGAALIRTNGKISEHTSTSKERTALFASFVIGLSPFEDTLANGQYLQAHALLRQEMETVAQLKAIRLGKVRAKKTPNVSVLEQSIARLYGGLSDAAHVAAHEIVHAATSYEFDETVILPGPTSGTRYFPAFDEGLSRRSFALHLMLIVNVIEELGLDLIEQHKSDAFSDRDAEAITLAMLLMRDEGLVEIG